MSGVERSGSRYCCDSGLLLLNKSKVSDRGEKT